MISSNSNLAPPRLRLSALAFGCTMALLSGEQEALAWDPITPSSSSGVSNPANAGGAGETDDYALLTADGVSSCPPGWTNNGGWCSYGGVGITGWALFNTSGTTTLYFQLEVSNWSDGCYNPYCNNQANFEVWVASDCSSTTWTRIAHPGIPIWFRELHALKRSSSSRQCMLVARNAEGSGVPDIRLFNLQPIHKF